MADSQKHKPTEEQRRLVKQLSGVGVPQDDICHIIDITKPTLHKHYRRELDLGMAEANAKVAGSLFNQATGGNTAAAIFWSKARMGWRETNNVELTGSLAVETIKRVIIDPRNRDG
jgi:hypothetical protein